MTGSIPPRVGNLISKAGAAKKLGGCHIRTVERLHARDPEFPRFVKLPGSRRDFLDEHTLDEYIEKLKERARGVRPASQSFKPIVEKEGL
jgi:hypothetical protein